MKRFSIFLITVFLIVAIVGCGPAPTTQHNLAITSTEGGSVTTPGEGMFTYDDGMGVNLIATPSVGYRFIDWTGDIDTIADSEAATTTITMSDSYFITANFVAAYDLTISSTAGGNVSTPGEGTFTYYEQTVVNLTAEAEEGYSFIEWTGDVETIADVNACATTITMNGDYSITAKFGYTPMVSAGLIHTVGLKSSGRVLAAGQHTQGQCNVGDWTDIVQVAAGSYTTLGIKSDGTVVAVGDNSYGQCDLGGWTDIMQVAAGRYHTVGLVSNGTVVATGYNFYGQCDVHAWTDIVQVAAGQYHTVGLVSNGTVVAAGYNNYEQCNVGEWTDIVQITAGCYHTVGLKSNSTMVAVGNNDDAQCDVGGWTDIMQVAAGGYHTVGLKPDGSVVAVGRNNDWGQCNVGGWTDIMQVAAGGYHTVGLKPDGTVIAVGRNDEEQCNVGDWDLF